MSSWLSISLPNPFKSDNQSASPPPDNAAPSSDDHCPSPAGGFKEDLSVLGLTIGRQLRGVVAAAFLAPPPDDSASTAAESSSQTMLGIRNDLVEIGGSFKSSLSIFSSNKAVSGISRFASNLLQFKSEGNEVEGDEDGDYDDEDETSEVAGVAEEVLDFVEEISLRSECWTDFPLALNKEFNMTDAQKEHASTVECLVPSLADLRHKICCDLSEENFWMIYFILLLPRLHEQDAKLLSTPEIVKAREILLQRLQNKRSAGVETSEDSRTINVSQGTGKANSEQGEGSLSQGKEFALETVNEGQGVELDQRWQEEEEEEEQVDVCTSSPNTQKQPESEEGVSFSDLENEDVDDLSGRLSLSRPAQHGMVASPNGSSEWVRLNESSETQGGAWKSTSQSTSRGKDSEGEDSNGWLTVDEADFDSLAAV